MRLLFVGDFWVGRGSGYAVILENICLELAERGHQITLLADHWEREEHDYPFQVIPSDYGWAPMQALRVHQALDFDFVILAMDVPKIVQLMQELKRQEIVGWPPACGLFAIESAPLVKPWAEALGTLHARFVISEFGQHILGRSALDSTFVPMTAQVPAQALSKTEARQALKEEVAWGNASLLDRDDLFVLTVADNQERKDLPVIAKALKHLRDEEDTWVTWGLVTAINSPHGWALPELWQDLWVNDQVVMFESLTTEELHWAYCAADCFVLASQAEGACLPLYEAMAHGLTCVAPKHTAITEALGNGRGILIEPAWATVHPWGNVTRYHTRPEDLAAAITTATLASRNGAAIEFVKDRTWMNAAQQIEEVLDG